MDEYGCDMDVNRRLANKIAGYLLNHPGAKDTLEGIAEWWLEIEYVEETVEQIDRALSWLCARGVVVEEKRSGISGYYKLNENWESRLSKEFLQG